MTKDTVSKKVANAIPGRKEAERKLALLNIPLERVREMLKQAETRLAAAEKHPVYRILNNLYKPGMSLAEYQKVGNAACKSDVELQQFALDLLCTDTIARICRDDIAQRGA